MFVTDAWKVTSISIRFLRLNFGEELLNPIVFRKTLFYNLFFQPPEKNIAPDCVVQACTSTESGRASTQAPRLFMTVTAISV